MAGQFIVTLGDASQTDQIIKGDFLHGHRQRRVAFVGRSNVGKSSLINALLKTRLAQVSHEPGKTRAIHFYLWKDINKIVADLPGYGYAKASHDERDRWERFIYSYFAADPLLERVVMLLDARHGPTPLDEGAIRFLSSESVPVTFVFAKFDTLKTQSERALRKKETAAKFAELGLKDAPVFWVSSKKDTGLRELTKALELDPAKGEASQAQKS